MKTVTSRAHNQGEQMWLKEEKKLKGNPKSSQGSFIKGKKNNSKPNINIFSRLK